MEPPIRELLQNCKCAVHRKLHDYGTNLFSGEEELCWRMFTDLKDDNRAAHKEHFTGGGNGHGGNSHSNVEAASPARGIGELICIFILMKGT